MPITINGSGSVVGISAGGLPDGVITTDDIAANAVTFAKIGTTEQGQLCKAWVNFDGTGTVAIRASYNVSSITDNGTGDYTVNFTTALVDANYSTICTGVSPTGNTNTFAPKVASDTDTALVTYSTTQVRVYCLRTSSTANDVISACVAIFR
jgi:hypothetical protein